MEFGVWSLELLWSLDVESAKSRFPIGVGCWSFSPPHGLSPAKSSPTPMFPLIPGSEAWARVAAYRPLSPPLAAVRTRAAKCNPRTHPLHNALLVSLHTVRCAGFWRIGIRGKEM